MSESFVNANVDREEDEGGLDILRLLEVLKRRWTVIIGSGAIVGVLATIVVMQITPLYSSVTTVAIETRKTQVVDVAQVVESALPDQATLATEAETIRSRDLLARVVDSLELYRDPEFLGQSSVSDGFKWWSPATWFGGHQASNKRSKDFVAVDAGELASQKAVSVSNLAANVRIEPLKNSYVLSVEVSSEDPAKAAKIANAIANEYISGQIGTKLEATRRATAWLEKRVEELRVKSVEADKAVETYRIANGIVGGTGDATVGDQQLTEVTTQLTMARAAKAEKQAQLSQIQRLLAKDGVGLESASATLQSPLIGTLRTQETEVLRKLSELRTVYGDKHPRIINANAELRDLREKITLEIRKIAAATANDLAVADAREKSLSAGLAAATSRSGSEKIANVKLRELETDAQSAKTLYENFLNRYKETSEQLGIQSPDARIVSFAQPAFYPSYPKKLSTLIAALVAGLIIGAALALALEHFDPYIRLAEEAEKIVKRPILAMLPLADADQGKPEDLVITAPLAPTTEALTSFRAALSTQLKDWPHNVVMFTSSIAGEGKTFTSVAYARSLAQLGQEVLLIDLDLRRPRVGQVLELDHERGFAEIINGTSTFDECLLKDPLTGLDVLLGGSKSNAPNELLLSDRFPQLLDQLRPLYDAIIIDTPPFAPISDSQVIAKHVDMAFLTVAWAKAPVSVVKHVATLMERLKVPLAGVVLTLVDLRRYASYDRIGYNYYYYRYNAYTYGD